MVTRRPDRVRGGPHDTFWEWCGKGELRLQCCKGCGELAWPVVEACGNCAQATLEWQRLSGRGRIVSWCSFERDYYKGAFPLPWDTILVELEEGPFFVSNPGDFTCGQASVGMAVAVSFVDCEDSGGAFRLPVFNRG